MDIRVNDKILFSFSGSNEEHIGTVKEVTDTYVVLSNPRTFIKKPSRTGIESVMIPFAMSVSSTLKEIVVNINCIQWYVHEDMINEDVIDSYNSEISGIILAKAAPTKKLII